MKKIKQQTYYHHWDSRFDWVEVPMTEFLGVGTNVPLHPNSRVSEDGRTAYLEAYTDGKRFMDQQIEKAHDKANKSGSPFVPLTMVEVCDGTVSSIRRLKTLEQVRLESGKALCQRK